MLLFYIFKGKAMNRLTFTWKHIYLLQIIFNFILGLYLLLFVDTLTNFNLNCLYLSIIFITFYLNFTKNKYLYIVEKWISILILIPIFSFYLANFFTSLSHKIPHENTILVTFYFLNYSVLYIPIIETQFAKFTNPITRIFIILLLFFNITLGSYFNPHPLSLFLQLIISTNLYGAIIFFILLFLIMKKWGFSQGFNLKHSTSKIWITLLLLLFIIWFAFFEQFLDIANSIPEAIYDWNNNVLLINFSFKKVLTALAASLIEEPMRGLNLLIILSAFKNPKKKVPLAIVLSSLIFALCHYGHLLNNPNFLNTSLQACAAFGIGCLLATIYLYTGKIWIIVGGHAFIDLIGLGFVSNNLLSNEFSQYLNGILSCAIITLLPIFVTILMMFGRRRSIINQNINLLI